MAKKHPKKPHRKPSNPNTKAVAILRHAFIEANEPEVKEAFWNLVTAMRGPDTDDWRLKMDTTSVIRAAVTTEDNCLGDRIPTGNRPYLSPHSLLLAKALAAVAPFPASNSHFAEHIKSAVFVCRHAK